MLRESAFLVDARAGNRDSIAFDLIRIEPIAIGTIEVPVFQNECGIAVGQYAGHFDQGECGIAIGSSAGRTFQGDYAVAVGTRAGSHDQGEGSVAIGRDAGWTGQGTAAIAIGQCAGQTHQPARSIVLNATGTALTGVTEADAFYAAPVRPSDASRLLLYDPTSAEIVHASKNNILPNGMTYSNYLYWNAATSEWAIGSREVHIGGESGRYNQSAGAVALGQYAGHTGQGLAAIAIGQYAGQTHQPDNSIVLNASGAALTTLTQAGALYVAPVRTGATSRVLYYDPTSKEVVHGVKPDNIPNGTTYSDYVFWNANTGTWDIGSNTVHVGGEAGRGNQGAGAVAVGQNAGQTNQDASSVAVGLQTGQFGQKGGAVALGAQAGQTNQGLAAIAIGLFAGQTNQPDNSIVLNASGAALTTLTQAGALYVAPVRTGAADRVLYYDPTSKEVVHGLKSDVLRNGTTYSDYLFWTGSTWDIGSNTVHVGGEAGRGNQGAGAVAVGQNAGQTNQDASSVAVGLQAGQFGQKGGAVALGAQAGQSNQGLAAIAIGLFAGQTNQPDNSIVLNASGAALTTLTQAGALYVAPVRTGAADRVLYYDPTSKEVVHGLKSDVLRNGTTYSDYLFWTGSTWDIGSNTVHVGGEAGRGNQGAGAVAVGQNAGQTNQDASSVAVGLQTGQFGQKGGAVALGAQAGQSNQGLAAIAIGLFAGQTNQPDNSIVLNASGAALTTLTQAGALYVAPVRTGAADRVLYYDPTSKEVVHGLKSDVLRNGTTYSDYLFWTGSTWDIGSNTVHVGGEAGRGNQGAGAVAVGQNAGQTNQDASSVAVGLQTGQFGQKGGAVALGAQAGQSNQGLAAIAIGLFAGQTNQPDNSIVLNASGAALTTLTQAGALYVAPVRTGAADRVLYYDPTSKEVVHGLKSDVLRNGTTYSDYLFWTGSTWDIGSNTVHVGGEAGRGNQGAGAVAVGQNAGQTNQDASSVAVGLQTGQFGQKGGAVALGAQAGQTNQGTASIAIGLFAGQTNQPDNSIVLNASGAALTTLTQAGALYVAPVRTGAADRVLYYDPVSKEVVHGLKSDVLRNGTTYSDYLFWTGSTWDIGSNTVHVGGEAGRGNQGAGAVAVGQNAGQTNQDASSVAVGLQTGQFGQKGGAVALGAQAGQTNQGTASIAIGLFAGQTNQPDNSIVLNASGAALTTLTQAGALYVAPVRTGAADRVLYYDPVSKEVVHNVKPASVPPGTTYSDYLFWTGSTWDIGSNTVHVGAGAAESNQGAGAVAIGQTAGQTNQGVNAVAVGLQTGQFGQKGGAVALGAQAGQTNQGTASIAIGLFAGQTNQPDNSIVLNASGAALTTLTQAGALYVAPVRTGAADRVLYYDPVSKEVVHNVKPASVPPGTTYSDYLFWTGSTWDIGSNTVHVGAGAAESNQGAGAVAIGQTAGQTNQGVNAVAVGLQTGQFGQKGGAVALGAQAGQTNQGTASIAIGLFAGQTNQPDNSIVLNASGAALTTLTQAGALYVAPVRTGAADRVLYYDPVSKEVVHNVKPASVPPGTTYSDYLFWTGSTWDIGSNTVHVGAGAAESNQGAGAVAIGQTAGQTNQGVNAVAVGLQTGQFGQKGGAVALGAQAGQTNQGTASIAIGLFAGQTNQPDNSIVLNASGAALTTLTQAGALYVAPVRTGAADRVLYYDPVSKEVVHNVKPASVPPGTTYSDYLFWTGSTWDIGSNTVHVGAGAAESNQGAGAVAIGQTAGQTNQGVNAVAVGLQTGQFGQKGGAVALGAQAGQTNQGTASIAIGLFAGQTNQPDNSIVLNASGAALTTLTQAGALYVAPIRTVTGSGSVWYSNNVIAAGVQYSDYLFWNPTLGKWDVGTSEVHLGQNAGQTGQGLGSVAVGQTAGQTNQAASSVAVGLQAGQFGQQGGAVALGAQAGQTNQGTASVAIGLSAGLTNQGTESIAIGYLAGAFQQQDRCVAIGLNAGASNQKQLSIAVGNNAGRLDQGDRGIAIGNAAAEVAQGESAVAIGRQAGQNTQGANAIAIGFFAGRDNQPANSIILNATGSVLANTTQTSALYVAPVKDARATAGGNSSGGVVMGYNTLTKEVSSVSYRTYFVDRNYTASSNNSLTYQTVRFNTGMASMFARINLQLGYPDFDGRNGVQWVGTVAYQQFFGAAYAGSNALINTQIQQNGNGRITWATTPPVFWQDAGGNTPELVWDYTITVPGVEDPATIYMTCWVELMSAAGAAAYPVRAIDYLGWVEFVVV